VPLSVGRLLFLFAIAKTVLPQIVASPTLPPADQQVLQRVRGKVLDTLDRLPRFVCTQLTERTSFEVKEATPVQRKLVFSDRLRMDVAITGNKEMYAWVGANHLDERGLSELIGGGAISTGWFGSFLAVIFRLDHPDFAASRIQIQNNQTLRAFEFHVPTGRSNYSVGPHGGQWLTSYKGSLLVNPANGDLLRLVVETDHPPVSARIRDAVTTIDYTHLQVRSSDFLLPAQARLQMLNDEGLESQNHTTFSGCHEFVGESKLSFDELPSGDNASAVQEPALDFPPHQVFSTTLSQDIDTANAAAGDAVLLNTSSAIRTNAKQVRLPKNSTVKARIIRLQFSYEQPSHMSMVLALESAEIAGKSIPISAAAATVDGRPAPLSLIDNGNVALISMLRVKPGYVLKHGLAIRWITAAAPATPSAFTRVF
jgi:hypothetical protein